LICQASCLFWNGRLIMFSLLAWFYVGGCSMKYRLTCNLGGVQPLVPRWTSSKFCPGPVLSIISGNTDTVILGIGDYWAILTDT
jgi:hypothetical protein